MLAALLTDIEGASHGFERGFVTYTKEFQEPSCSGSNPSCSTQ